MWARRCLWVMSAMGLVSAWHRSASNNQAGRRAGMMLISDLDRHPCTHTHTHTHIFNNKVLIIMPTEANGNSN